MSLLATMSPFAPPKVAAAGQAIHCVKPLGVAELNTASATFAGAKGDYAGSPRPIPLLSDELVRISHTLSAGNEQTLAVPALRSQIIAW